MEHLKTSSRIVITSTFSERRRYLSQVLEESAHWLYAYKTLPVFPDLFAGWHWVAERWLPSQGIQEGSWQHLVVYAFVTVAVFAFPTRSTHCLGVVHETSVGHNTEPQFMRSMGYFCNFWIACFLPFLLLWISQTLYGLRCLAVLIYANIAFVSNVWICWFSKTKMLLNTDNYCVEVFFHTVCWRNVNFYL